MVYDWFGFKEMVEEHVKQLPVEEVSIKTYLLHYQHNYGLGVTLINAISEEQVKEIADSNNLIWQPYEIVEINQNPTTVGVIFQE
jgi:hypothetical protein